MVLGSLRKLGAQAWKGECQGPVFSGIPEAVSLTKGEGRGHHVTLPSTHSCGLTCWRKLPQPAAIPGQEHDALALQLDQALSSAWGSSGSECSAAS